MTDISTAIAFHKALNKGDIIWDSVDAHVLKL